MRLPDTVFARAIPAEIPNLPCVGLPRAYTVNCWLLLTNMPPHLPCLVQQMLHVIFALISAFDPADVAPGEKGWGYINVIDNLVRKKDLQSESRCSSDCAYE